MRRIHAIRLSLQALSLAHATQIITIVIGVTPLLLLCRMGLILKCVDHAHILMVWCHTGRLRNLRVKLLNFSQINGLRKDTKIFGFGTRLLHMVGFVVICLGYIHGEVGVSFICFALLGKVVVIGFHIENLWFLCVGVFLEMTYVFVSDVEMAVQLF